MKRFIIGFAAASILFTGCSKDDDTLTYTPQEGGGNDGIAHVMGASIEKSGSETKTYLSGFDIKWQVNDMVATWNHIDRTPVTYKADEVSDDGSATFSSNNGVNVSDGNTYISVYPASILTNVSGDETSGYVDITLPATQVYQAGIDHNTFGKDANIMAAIGTDIMQMQFTSLCGVIRVKLYADKANAVQVNSIRLDAKSSAPLSGEARISYDTEAQTVTLTPNSSETTSSLTLSGIGGSELGAKGAGRDFYFVVPAGTYKNLEFYVYTNYDVDGAPSRVAKLNAEKTITVEANTIYDITGTNGLGIEVTELKRYAVGDVVNDASGAPVGVVFELTGGYNTDGSKASSVKIINYTGSSEAVTYATAENNRSGSWRLPTELELTTIKTYVETINAGLAQIAGSQSLDFSSKTLYYWSSSVDDGDHVVVGSRVGYYGDDDTAYYQYVQDFTSVETVDKGDANN